MSEEKYPRVHEDGNGWWFVVLSPTAYFRVPDRLTAVRCVLAAEMEELLRRWVDSPTGVLMSNEMMDRCVLESESEALLKRLDDAR